MRRVDSAHLVVISFSITPANPDAGKLNSYITMGGVGV